MTDDGQRKVSLSSKKNNYIKCFSFIPCPNYSRTSNFSWPGLMNYSKGSNLSAKSEAFYFLNIPFDSPKGAHESEEPSFRKTVIPCLNKRGLFTLQEWPFMHTSSVLQLEMFIITLCWQSFECGEFNKPNSCLETSDRHFCALLQRVMLRKTNLGIIEFNTEVPTYKSL